MPNYLIIIFHKREKFFERHDSNGRFLCSWILISSVLHFMFHFLPNTKQNENQKYTNIIELNVQRSPNAEMSIPMAL